MPAIKPPRVGIHVALSAFELGLRGGVHEDAEERRTDAGVLAEGDADAGDRPELGVGDYLPRPGLVADESDPRRRPRAASGGGVTP